MIGYVTFYFVLTGSNVEYYGSVSMDFAKPLHRHTLTHIRRCILSTYQKIDPDINSIRFCSKEEYEANETDPMVSARWDGESDPEVTLYDGRYIPVDQ